MLRNNKGFSLIELMVVVAIIAILSMIAVPSFQGFQAKARQKEGFSLLSAYYTAAQATNAEAGFFPGDFVETGFQPTGELHYRVTAAEGPQDLPFGTISNNCISTTGACTCIPACNPAFNSTWVEDVAPGTGVGAAAPVAGACGAAAVTMTTFNVLASGRIRSGGAVDTYRMNQIKNLMMCNDGLN